MKCSFAGLKDDQNPTRCPATATVELRGAERGIDGRKETHLKWACPRHVHEVAEAMRHEDFLVTLERL